MGFSRITVGYDAPLDIAKIIVEGTSGAVARADHQHNINLLHYHQNAPELTKTTPTNNNTYTLTAASESLQVYQGSATGVSIKLPDATTLDQGWKYELINQTSATLTIRLNDNSIFFTLSQTSTAHFTLESNATTNGSWISWQVLNNGLASGVINYNLVSSTPFATSSRTPTYALITGFSLTPQAGTYAVWYNASVYYTTTPKAHFWAIYKAGAVIADSLRQQDTAHSNQTMVDSTMTVTSFNGSQTCDVRVACDNTGTLTVNNRTLLLIRLGT